MDGEQQTTRKTPSSDHPGRPVAKHWGIDWIFPGLGRRDLLSKAAVSIGRATTCDIQLKDEGVSRIHAEVVRQGPVWVIRDCGSRNGTFVDGALVGHEALHPGAVIRVGTHVGVVRATASRSMGSCTEVQPGFWLGETTLAELAPAFSVAPTDLPVSISGETGTGKERVARAIHALSARKGTFVGLNCAAISEQLAESELFGHVKGAFTGARSAHPGHIRAAHDGTLFLDEIADLPLGMQSKLLRVLQEGVVTPVGAVQPIAVDVRVVTASQRPLVEYVQRGTFREDLMMRLTGLEVRIPPLREHREDIFPLFEEFTRRASTDHVSSPCASAFVEALCLSPWRGNVRQLEILARRLTAVHGGRRLERSDFPDEHRKAPGQHDRDSISVDGLAPDGTINRKHYDLERLRVAMRECGGNLTEAARTIGLSRMRAYRLIHELRSDVLNVESRPPRGYRGAKAGQRRQES